MGDAQLRFAAVQNKAGTFVAPTLAATSAAAAGAKINDDLSYDPLWAEGTDVYPIAAPTWILVYRNQPDPSKASVLREFLRFVLTDGQTMAESVDYAPVPAALATRALAQLDRITST